MDTSSKKVILAALTGNAFVSVTKFSAAAYTGSSAMLSEAIHSLVDTGNQALLLLGMQKAKKPADEEFPFGYGKEVYFWSFVVAILIFAMGSGISVYEGIQSLIHPKPVTDVYINYLVLLVAMLFEGAAWYYALREFTRAKGKWGYIEAVKRSKDPSIFMVLFEDSAAMLGLVVAFFGIFLGQLTGCLYFDGIASVIIGLILGGTAVWLAYETKGLLIGESANSEIVNGIRSCVKSYEGVEQVNEILTMHMGPDYVLVNISIDFADQNQIGDIETMIAAMDRQIKQQFSIVKRIFIEAESA